MPDFGFADYTAHVPNPFAQWRYLRAVAECVPEAWSELAALPVGDEAQLGAWAEQRGFTDRWALDAARQHRKSWDEDPDLVGMVISVGGVVWEPVMPDFPRWNPFVESEAALRARFEAYIEACKAMPGMTPTPADTRTGDAHFEWLALHHAGHYTYDQIADWLAKRGQHIDSKAVSRPIHRAAELVGLTLRPVRGRKL